MQNGENKIRVKDVINSPYCVEDKDGLLLYNRINESLTKFETVEVDFADVSIVNSFFLNSAFSSLLERYTFKEIQKKVKVLFDENSKVYDDLYKRVINNASEKLVSND